LHLLRFWSWCQILLFHRFKQDNCFPYNYMTFFPWIQEILATTNCLMWSPAYHHALVLPYSLWNPASILHLLHLKLTNIWFMFVLYATVSHKLNRVSFIPHTLPYHVNVGSGSFSLFHTQLFLLFQSTHANIANFSTTYLSSIW
jgi:hypothetical protein